MQPSSCNTSGILKLHNPVKVALISCLEDDDNLHQRVRKGAKFDHTLTLQELETHLYILQVLMCLALDPTLAGKAFGQRHTPLSLDEARKTYK